MSISGDKIILSKCDAVAEVIYINVELQRAGHTPFQTQCDGDPHGDTAAKKKKYLTKKISTSETSGLSATQQNCGTDTVLWTLDKPDAELDVKIDPFTGLTQKGADVDYVPAATTIENGSSCTTDSITSRRTEVGGTYTKCGGSTANRFIDISFQNENTDEKLSTNASSLINHFTIFNTTEIPEYNTFVDVIPGTDGVQSRSGASVSSMPKTEPWRAKHFVDESGINKSQLYVKFLEDTIYTEATGSYEDDGTVSNNYFPAGSSGTVKNATAGQILTVEPPAEKNTFIEIHVCQHLTVCSLPSCDMSITGTKANESKKALPTADCSNCTGSFSGGCGESQMPTCPCACVYTNAARFVGTNGKRYAKKTTSSSSSISASVTASIDVENKTYFPGSCTAFGNDPGDPETYGYPVLSADGSNDDFFHGEISGSATISGSKTSSSSSVVNTCTDNPDPVSASGDFTYGGSVNSTDTVTHRGSRSNPSNPNTFSCSNPDRVITDYNYSDGSHDYDDYISASVSLSAPSLSGTCDSETEIAVTVSVNSHSDLSYGGSDGHSGYGDAATKSGITVSNTFNKGSSSATSTATFSTDFNETINDNSDGYGPNPDLRAQDITASGSFSGTASRSIVLSDPVEADSNYSETVIPNTSVPEDDPAYDDGVRDGTLTESIDYSGSTRSHVNLTEITFDVTTIPSPALYDRKSLTHRSYLNYLISELDKSDESKAILSHTTITDLVDTRCNNPHDENDRWTVEKKRAINISLGDEDGNTASVTRATCFSVVDFGSESSCPQPN